MKRFCAALQFLTILPLPAGLQPDARALGGSLPFFPVVGLLIGAAVALADRLLGLFLPAGVTAVLAVIFLIAASGGLHMDGLADTADGFFSSRPRALILEIMRDSRTGPMGVLAVVAVFALKAALLAAVAGPWRWWVLLLTPVAGRSSLLIQMGLLPYARTEGGLAAAFLEGRSRGHALWGAAFLLVAGGLAGGLPGLAAGAFACCAGLLLSAWVFRRIGGLTGDTLGASCELTELCPALVAAAMMHGGGA